LRNTGHEHSRAKQVIASYNSKSAEWVHSVRHLAE
jgi:hypothetical protein